MIKSSARYAGEIIISLLLFLIIINSYSSVLKWWNDSRPISDRFVVRQLQVSSIIFIGDRIRAVYDIEIVKAHQ